MVEKPDQIEKHIELTRNELGDNFRELEHKVKQATDWKTYVERSPMTAIGLAVGGGVLLGTMVSSTRGAPTARPSETHVLKPERRQVTDTWDTLKSALIGLAALKVRRLLDEMLPGFGDQFEKAEREYSANNLTHRALDTAHRM